MANRPLRRHPGAKLVALPAILLAASLAACAPGNCDPSTAGFFDGIACQSSGAFDQRQNRLQTDLSGARNNLQLERGRADAAAYDANQAQGEQSRMSGRLAAMGRENAVLRARLNTAARQQGTDTNLVRQRQAELAALERDRTAAARSGANPAQVADLERRRRLLLDAAAGL